MLLWGIHREDVKATVRKRYRTLEAFERAEKLGKNSVADFLRGRTTSRTEEAIRRVLIDAGVIGESMTLDGSASGVDFYGKIQGAN